MTAEIPARFTPIWDSMPDDQPAPLDRRPGQAYPSPLGKRYVLPCHYLTHGGIYEYVLVDAAQARRWLLAGPCGSYLTHPFLHRAFEDLIGFLTPPPQRGPLPQLGYHDDALIFQLEGYETLPDLKRGDSRRVRRMVQEQRFAIGLLRRLA